MRGFANVLCATIGAIAAVHLGACAAQTEKISVAAETGDIALNAWLGKPDDEGPFPTVVLLHGCSGTERSTSHHTVWRGLNRHADLLNENGYATLILDSFGPRGISDGCTRPADYLPMRMADARAALDHLRALPSIDPDRIGLVGLSLGASTALSAVSNFAARDRRGGGYAAVVAFYPWCAPSYTRFDAPILILIGEDDDWTPADLCRQLEDRLGAENDITLAVYAGAHHSFDLPMPGRFVIEGHVVAPNDAARLDAQSRMVDFFDTHLAVR